MAIGWYIVPYKRRQNEPEPIRYPAIDDYTPQIYGVGGRWAETEILGNRCLVKVSAPPAALNKLDTIFKRIPKDRLDDNLADLPTTVKNALRNELLDAGYTLAEVRNRFGNDLSQYTLRDVLHFMTSRRLKPRYDAATDTIVCDGPAQPCRSIDSVDTEVIG